ncbi:MAG: hypothetical protein BGP12_11660 [Rhodospirillales bacterium 70-18]|nr:MAG: hypothetical protein BGP12_11660 [Rhodospirillales bacterium 70-18]
MTATPPNRPAPSRPTLTDRAQAEKQARAEREAAALRANLRKRKQQVQARQAQDAPPERKP